MTLTTREQQEPILIVGAGMAGLSCAVHLYRAGLDVCIFEADKNVGGRVQTDEVDGFLLDHGFQVYLDAYPETGKLLDLKALDLRPFKSGALVYRNGKLHRLMDVFRHPGSLWSSVTAPVGSFMDKLRVGLLRTRLWGSSLDAIAARKDLPTDTYLRERGFSDAMIDLFFRSFYGGIFLERELRTSSRMFEFTFKMFSRGRATLPAKGMGEIPQQLAVQLPSDSVRLSTPVASIEPRAVVLKSGERVPGSAVVVATDASAVRRLLPDLKRAEPKWRSVTTLYFAADSSPINEAIICLNGSGTGRVNSVSALSDAVSAYAPSDKTLLSVVVLGLPEEEALEVSVQEELVSWFGPTVKTWQHLRTDRIERALPEQLPESSQSSRSKGFLKHKDIWICGDHLSSASIEGAVISGKQVAKSILKLQ
ncbi:MAG: protoporphyrinogen oxidase [Lentimonas sp.]|jgi:protoporphyrinogen oxidase